MQIIKILMLLQIFSCWLLTLKANWFDTLTVKQWEIMINNVLLFSVTNEEAPYKQLQHY